MARGGFFTVDRGAWRAAMALGLDAGVSYLVMASCARGAKRFTGASAFAVANRTRVYRQRATVAIEAMVAAGVVRRDRGGTHPHYFLPKVHDMPGSSASRAQSLTLPNTLTTCGDGRRAPLDLIHDAAEPVAALRLLLDLYEACSAVENLDEYGVPMGQLAAAAPRRLAAELEHHVVWFLGRPGEPTSQDGSFADLSALGELERVGLVESRLFLVDVGDDEASIRHRADRAEVNTAAHAAGLRLLSMAGYAETGDDMALPVARRGATTDVQLVRLYRPRVRSADVEEPGDDSDWWREEYGGMGLPSYATPPQSPGPQPVKSATVLPLKTSKRSRRRDRGRH